MAISDDLFSAILAMDAYNRGVVDPKLIVTGPIGDATLLASRWGNGPAPGKPLARYGAVVVRSLAACLAARRSSLKLMVSRSTESDMSAPSIIEGRPWNIMQESTCHWNTRACA